VGTAILKHPGRYRGGVGWRDILRTPWAGVAAGLAGVALVTLGVELASDHIDVLSMAVVYQLLVLVVSAAWGLRAGLSTSLAAVLAVNWFFVEPTGTLTIGDSRGGISLAVFAVTAVITSRLTADARGRRRESETRRREAELLAGLAQTVLEQIGPGPPGPAVAEAAARALAVQRCDLVLDPPGADAHGEASRVTPSPRGFTVPLVAGGRPLGLMEVGAALPVEEPRWERPGVVAAVAGLAAVAVERRRLFETALEAEGLRRSDELKTALLRGVSHEFRTPLTAIRTAAHALVEDPSTPGAEGLLAAMTLETERLERLVGNLLDLSRLEAGGLTARLDWCAPAEIAAGAVDAADPLLAGRAVGIDVPDDLPLVRADAVLCERILVNLLHNAARHGAAPIRLEGGVVGERLELAVSDAGPGVDGSIAGRAFEPFVAGPRTGGTGIGLALSRGLARAQGGELRLEQRGGRTRVVLDLPLSPVAQAAA
jgi:two-component system, OmpR family, sensor histidine kinase KdpD